MWNGGKAENSLGQCGQTFRAANPGLMPASASQAARIDFFR